MHILLALIGILAAIAFWWFRIKQIGQAGAEMADAAGRVKGAFKRRNLRKKADSSVFTAIEDARTAAVVVCLSIASEQKPLSELARKRLEAHMRNVLGYDDAQEDLVFAQWAVDQSQSPRQVIKHILPLLKAQLSSDEAGELMNMIIDVAKINAPLNHQQQSDLAYLGNELNVPNT